MIRITAIFVLTIALANQSQGADPKKIYTQPDVPSQDALDRLNMKMVWRTFSPMEGRRDGYHDIQIMDNYVLAQTRSGTVILFHGTTGETLWKTNFGKPYQVVHNLAFNDKFIFAINENDIYALFRSDGSIAWRSSFTIAITATPSADNIHIFLCGSDNRVYCYALPMFGPNRQFIGYEKSDRLGKLRLQTVKEIEESESGVDGGGLFVSKIQARTMGPQPLPTWVYKTRLKLDFPPLVTDDIVGLIGQKGEMITLSKFSEIKNTTTETNTGYATDGLIIATPEVSNNLAFIASLDSCLHAYDLQKGKLAWRYTIGSAITHRPFITQDEVFVSGERNGLAKVATASGEPMWAIPSQGRLSPTQEKSDRVIAVNPKFVYSMDKSGRMVILDRNTGTALTTWDVHDFVFPVTNRSNDRIFLAANNGLLVCLRDKDYPSPVLHFPTMQVEPVSPDAAKGPVTESLSKALETPITEADGGEKPLKEALDIISKKYMINFEISKKAFLDGKIEGIEDRPVKLTAIDNKPLNEWLKEILGQIQVSFQPVGDKVLLFPAKAP